MYFFTKYLMYFLEKSAIWKIPSSTGALQSTINFRTDFLGVSLTTGATLAAAFLALADLASCFFTGAFSFF